MGQRTAFYQAGFTDAQVTRLKNLSGTELAYLDGITPGTVTASKALIVDSNKDLSALRNLTAVNLTLSGTYTTGVTPTITAGATQTQAGATLLTTQVNVVSTVATALDGVRLPSAVAGLLVTVKNAGANVLKLYPFSGDSIDNESADAAILLPAGAMVSCFAISTSRWYTTSYINYATAVYAGAPGSVGTVLVYPTTTGKGVLQISATDNAGDTTTAILAAAQAGARTYTLPDNFANSAFGMVKQVTDAGPMTATGGAFGSLAYNTSDSKVYFCTVAHATAATWAALN